ncbi:MAG TPA: hypothetical protein VER58_21160 [Thermoanaerobaculia bacterium]|nr:hypothetical protein [Thermoanaerobaculia bacterium]
MRTITVLILVAAILALLVFVHYQPAGSVTVFRDRQHLVMRRSMFFVRARGIACRTTMSFDDVASGTTTTHNAIPIRIRFTYVVPESVPPDWPPGTWCASLRQRVQYAVTRSSSELTTADLIDRRRDAADRIADAVKNDLNASGVRASNVSVQLNVPPRFDSLHPAQQVRKRAPVSGALHHGRL